MTRTTDAFDDPSWKELRNRFVAACKSQLDIDPSESLETGTDDRSNQSEQIHSLRKFFGLLVSAPSHNFGMVTAVYVTMEDLADTGVLEIVVPFTEKLGRDKKALLTQLSEVFSPDEIDELQRSGKYRIETGVSWSDSLVDTYAALIQLENALSQASKASVEQLADFAFDYGGKFAELKMRRRFEEAVSKFENSKSGRVKGNAKKTATSESRAKLAVAELHRRMNSNPLASKTSHIEQMSKEKDGEVFRWGCRANLIKWCKHIKSRKAKKSQ